MSKDIRIKKGLDIPLKGKAEQLYAQVEQSEVFAVKPPDFHGVFPKLFVKEGDEVKAGTPLFYSKDDERIKFTSPVSGEIAEIHRGEKRRLLEVRILADKEIKYEDFGKADPNEMERDDVVERLLDSGLWPFIRQRPYAVMANPSDTPKFIFISCFNTAPLSPDMDFVVHGHEKEFQTGIDAMRKLTEGKVHLGVDGNTNPSPVFMECKGVEVHRFRGPHPAGNVGVQIHHVDPINSGDVVWYLSPQDVITIGRLFIEGRYNAMRNVALAGSEVEKPRYYKILMGSSIKNLVKNNLKNDHVRYISGDVLTGERIGKEGFLGFYDSLVTVIPEGDKPEFMGWLAPGFDKFSVSRALMSWLVPRREMVIDTNMHGEERPFVVTGEYEKVFPFDIYPVQLLKAILVDDIESMEQLGLYEVAEEDFALCEVICTSKTPVQQIVRKGLDTLQKEMS